MGNRCVLAFLLIHLSTTLMGGEGRSRRELRAESRRICQAAQAGVATPLGARQRPPVLGPVREVLGGHDQALRFERDHPVRSDPRLERIGHEVAAHSDRPLMNFQFRVLQARRPLNAFSLLGGHIYVSAGFLEEDAFTDDELAALLGHEIAHAAFRDVPQEYLERWFLSYHAQTLCEAPTDARTVVGAVQALEQRLAHDRHAQELSADQYGGLYAHRAGYSFTGGFSLMQKLVGAREDETTFGNVPGAVGTHPPFSARSEALRASQAGLLKVAMQFDEGNAALDDHRFVDALEVFEAILGVFPDSLNARLNLASALHGQYRALRKVGDPAPELLIAPGMEADTLVTLLRGEEPGVEEPILLQRAQAHYRAILDAEPGHPLARNNLAAALFDDRDLPAAIAELELLAGREHVAPLTYRNLAICYRARARKVGPARERLLLEQARDQLLRFLDEVPSDGSALPTLQDIERRLRQLQRGTQVPASEAGPSAAG